MDNTSIYMPTPSEIAAGCLEVQKDWSTKERRKRLAQKSVPVRVDQVAYAALERCQDRSYLRDENE